MMRRILMGIPLAQLADLFPEWVWYALIAVGLLAPIVALMIKRVGGGTNKRGNSLVPAFYAIALPLGAVVCLGRTESAVLVLSFLLLMPAGVVLGAIILTSGK